MNSNINLRLVLFIFALILLVYLLFTLLSYEKARNRIYYIRGGCEYHRWGCCPDKITSKLDFLGSNCIDDKKINKNREEDIDENRDENRDEDRDEVSVYSKMKDEVDEKCLEKEEEYIKKRNDIWR